MGFRVVRRAQEPHRIVKLWVRLEDVERPVLVTISVPSYSSVHVFDSTSTWMIPCSVALGRGWSSMKVVPSLSFLSWWSVIREWSHVLGGGGLLSHFRCHFVSWGSLAGFAQSSSSFMTARCVLVRLCPRCSSLFRCLARFEMTGWRNRAVVFPSQSSA